uniref:Uncharacterized protein n=1 Tax=Anas zonorhyncha TaxID=75864 RepID=A0A8B9U481_9AVES
MAVASDRQHKQVTVPAGPARPWDRVISRLSGHAAPWIILPPDSGPGISTLALCFSAPAEGSSCSRLSPWVFLASALAVKTALMTVGLVVLFHRSCGQYKTLPQNAPGWHCIPSGSASQSE